MGGRRRGYHASRSIADALRILKDSANYDLDPMPVEAMVAWTEDLARRLGRTLDTLNAADLLGERGQAFPAAVPASSI